MTHFQKSPSGTKLLPVPPCQVLPWCVCIFEVGEEIETLQIPILGYVINLCLDTLIPFMGTPSPTLHPCDDSSWI